MDRLKAVLNHGGLVLIRIQGQRTWTGFAPIYERLEEKVITGDQ